MQHSYELAWRKNIKQLWGHRAREPEQWCLTDGRSRINPHRANTIDVPKVFGRALYRGRARIEQAIGKRKRFKRIALRCEKTQQNFASFVALAAASVSVKSVRTA